jgi:hypothetical protein
MKPDQSHPPQPSPEALRALASLREAVHDAFEKKRRLGQYAVVWKDGKVQMLRGDELITGRSSVDDST